jgi:hypothetical protein
MHGRLVLLTKRRLYIVPVEETRPSVDNSHIYKIREKAIALKLKEVESTLLKVGQY